MFGVTHINIVWIGIAIDVATIVLGILCMRNFGEGLQPFVQRGITNKSKHNDLELNKTNTNDTWRIDD
jgi:hypothetical protein